MKKNLSRTVIIFAILAGLISLQKISAEGGSLSLVGCQYPEAVNAGEGFDITFYLLPLEPIDKDCGMFIHLLSKGTMINADVTVPYPTSKWTVGKLMKLGPFRVYVPPDTTIGNYSIEAGLFWTQETVFGTSYKKLPYLNCPRIKDWQVGSILVKAIAEEALPEEGACSIYVQNSLTKIFPQRPYFLGDATKEIHLTAAKNEYESAQISIAALEEELRNIKMVKSKLVHQEGKGVVSEKEIKLFLVGYANTEKPFYNTPRVGLWPDPLMPLTDHINIEKGKFKTVWVEVHVPKDTPGGKYAGKIDIMAEDKIVDSVNILITVWGFPLPDQTHLKTAFDLREDILLDHYPKEQWEGDSRYRERVERIKKAYCLDMLKHRLDPIHNAGNPVFLSKKGDAYKLDFSDFDKKVEFYLTQGQKTFSIGEYWPWQSKDMWGRWYGLKDEESVLKVFSAYGKHLEEKGWLENAYAYIFDETFYRVKEVTALIHKAHPGIRNLLTMTPDLAYKDIDIWCPRINNFDPDCIQELKPKGKDVWTYVASPTRPYPSLNLDLPSIEYRILPWICWKFKIEGLLYWSVNWWVNVNPWESAVTFPNQNGNGCLYYPGKDGPIGSIRLKTLRDGLEDYELFYMLKTKLDALREAGQLQEFNSLMEKAEETLSMDGQVGELPAYYTHDLLDINEGRRQAAELIQEIDKKLIEIRRLNEND